MWVHGIIENKYLVFVPSFCHQASKTSGISYLFYTNEVTHGGVQGPRYLQDGGWRQKDEAMIKGLELSAPSHDPQGRERG